MDDGALVSGFEGVGDLDRNAHRLVDRDRTLRDAIGQRRSLDELEHQSHGALALFEAVDRRDVGMVQCRQCFGFALEPGDALRIRDERRRQDLDRDFSIELRVARAIDLTHPTAAERRDDDVGTEHQAAFESRDRPVERVRRRLAAAVQQIDSKAVERPGATVLGEKRLDLSTDIRFHVRQQLGAAILRTLLSGVKKRLDLIPAVGGHAAQASVTAVYARFLPPSSRCSQARARLQSRFTVAGDELSAWAVSSMLMPLKKRHSTTCARRGFRVSRRLS